MYAANSFGSNESGRTFVYDGVFFGAGTYGCNTSCPTEQKKLHFSHTGSESLVKNTLGKVMARGDAEAEEKRSAFFRAADTQALIASAAGAHSLDLCAAKSAAIGFALRVIAGTKTTQTNNSKDLNFLYKVMKFLHWKK